MVDVDYKWFLNANPDGYEEGKRIVAYVFTELKNSTIRNIDLRRTHSRILPKLISGEVEVTTHTRIMEVSEA